MGNARGEINASMRMVPTASKKLFMVAGGRALASDVRAETEERPLTDMPLFVVV